MSKVLKIKADIMDCLTTDYPILQRENIKNQSRYNRQSIIFCFYTIKRKSIK